MAAALIRNAAAFECVTAERRNASAGGRAKKILDFFSIFASLA
jgi:hypothetical protein